MTGVSPRDTPVATGIATDLFHARRRLPILPLGNALMRMAGGAGGVLVGPFLAQLALPGAPVNGARVATLGAVRGALRAAARGQWLAIDGLIYGTLAMALIALAPLARLRPQEALRGTR